MILMDISNCFKVPMTITGNKVSPSPYNTECFLTWASWMLEHYAFIFWTQWCGTSNPSFPHILSASPILNAEIPQHALCACFFQSCVYVSWYISVCLLCQLDVLWWNVEHLLLRREMLIKILFISNVKKKCKENISFLFWLLTSLMLRAVCTHFLNLVVVFNCIPIHAYM